MLTTCRALGDGDGAGSGDGGDDNNNNNDDDDDDNSTRSNENANSNVSRYSIACDYHDLAVLYRIDDGTWLIGEAATAALKWSNDTVSMRCFPSSTRHLECNRQRDAYIG